MWGRERERKGRSIYLSVAQTRVGCAITLVDTMTFFQSIKLFASSYSCTLILPVTPHHSVFHCPPDSEGCSVASLCHFTGRARGWMEN